MEWRRIYGFTHVIHFFLKNDQEDKRGSKSLAHQLEQLTIIIHNSGLLLAAVHREANDLHLHKGVNDLAGN